jgi:membrane protein required for colicin V production
MIGAPFNVFDAVVLSVLGLSALVAFFRGFIRELLSLGAWIGAAIITLYLFPHATDFMKHHMKNEHLAAGAAALGTYIGAFIAISLVNAIILRYVKTGMEVGLLDNFLGLIFGCFRGAFIISLAYLIMMSVISKDNPPEWLKTSFTKDYAQEGADFLIKVAPGYLHNLEGLVKKHTDDKEESTDSDTPNKTYNQKNLDRLLNSMSSDKSAEHK